MTAYYNEIDADCCIWLQSLINRGMIPAGDIDDRSIEEVSPDDIRSYTQHHWFAGIGGWAYACRLAGWPDDRPIWTASVPCQPFSGAGRGRGAADKRHLWPALYALIEACRPSAVVGEQVSGPLGRQWLSALRDDLGDAGYAVGAADLPAAAIGAPHRRNRLYWMAVTDCGRFSLGVDGARKDTAQAVDAGAGTDGLANTGGGGRERVAAPASGADGRRVCLSAERGGAAGGLGVADGDGRAAGRTAAASARHGGAAKPASGDGHGLSHPDGARSQGHARDGHGGGESGWFCPVAEGPAGPDGPWHDRIYTPFVDGYWRPIPPEPRLFPLADGVPRRVARLRAVGNAIVPQVGAAFLEATGLMEVVE